MIGIAREPPSYFELLRGIRGTIVPLFSSLCTELERGSCGGKRFFVHFSQRSQLEIQNKQSGGRIKKKFVKWLKYRIEGDMM